MQRIEIKQYTRTRFARYHGQMSARRVKRIPAVAMDADHPRILAAVRAGRRLADERSGADSWHLEPLQIPVELLAGAVAGETLTILRAWADGYRARCGEIEAEQAILSSRKSS